MRTIVRASFLAIVSLLSVAVPLFAHHGNASYEKKTLTVKGTVTAWLWRNPHTILTFDVKDDKGNVVHWTGEWTAPYTLVNEGFTKDTFKPGDMVTVTLDAVAKSGVPIGRVEQVVLPNGQVMREKTGDGAP